jgi:hypothetical protein
MLYIQAVECDARRIIMPGISKKNAARGKKAASRKKVVAKSAAAGKKKPGAAGKATAPRTAAGKRKTATRKKAVGQKPRSPDPSRAVDYLDAALGRLESLIANVVRRRRS